MNLLEYEATNHEAVRSYQLWYNYPSFYTTERVSVIAFWRPQRYCFSFPKEHCSFGRENLDPNDVASFLGLPEGYPLETADTQKLMS